MQIEADSYTPTDDTLIPTGKIEPVKGTPFDFTSPTPIGKHIKEIKADPQGFDLNYVLDGDAGKLRPCAMVEDPKSGRYLRVMTTEPGVQFYSGNFLNDTIRGKSGSTYPRRAAFCLETQHFPDSPNKPNFPSTILKPGSQFKSSTTYKFSSR